MDFFLNTTNKYHINDLNSLGWELTVCNALYPPQSPCRKALQSNEPFGAQLYRYLEKIIPMGNISTILEIGGGMGYLMHDFLSLNPRLKATMLDISPYLLAKQKEILQGSPVNFLEKDILQIEINSLSLFDMVIMNENLGDLPTLAFYSDTHGYKPQSNLRKYLAASCGVLYPPLRGIVPLANSATLRLRNWSFTNKDNSDDELSYEKAIDFIEKYQLSITEGESINTGAWEALENLCLAGIKYIYLSEHSCEAKVPAYLKPYIHFDSSGAPERIVLKGHDEYTIKISYLQRIAETFNYKVVRGPFADFLKLNFNDKVRTALCLSVPHTDEQEIIRQFVYDLYKYEYLILIRGDEK